MSQEKVDNYKKEKKNRKKTMKVNKIKKALIVLVLSLGLGALIGIPLGKYIYKQQKEEAERNRTISSLQYESWFDTYWQETYGDLVANSELQQKINEFNEASFGSETDASDSDAASE
ncbi:MAG: hypothetical protein K6E10_10600 [Eubacterium sp.]|nr:hypothetical protein [Eubacterium sp.]